MKTIYILLISFLCSCVEGKSRETSTQNFKKIFLFYEWEKYDGKLYKSIDGVSLLSIEIREKNLMNAGYCGGADSIVGVVFFYDDQIENSDTLSNSHILASGIYSKKGDELLFELVANSIIAGVKSDIIRPMQTSIISTNDLYSLNDLYLGKKCRSIITFINYRKLNKSKNVDGELQRHISDEIRNR